MKKYRLSNTSTQFQNFLKGELKGESARKFKLSADGKAIFIWLYCDQDLADLSFKYAEHVMANAL